MNSSSLLKHSACTVYLHTAAFEISRSAAVLQWWRHLEPKSASSNQGAGPWNWVPSHTPACPTLAGAHEHIGVIRTTKNNRNHLYKKMSLTHPSSFYYDPCLIGNFDRQDLWVTLQPISRGHFWGASPYSPGLNLEKSCSKQSPVVRLCPLRVMKTSGF